MTKAYEELCAKINETNTTDGDVDEFNEIREAVIYYDSFPAASPLQAWAAERVNQIDRDELTFLALSMSLCPMHLHDYAICFDDETDECKAIREVWPGHDT